MILPVVAVILPVVAVILPVVAVILPVVAVILPVVAVTIPVVVMIMTLMHFVRSTQPYAKTMAIAQRLKRLGFVIRDLNATRPMGIFVSIVTLL
ncbi:hypothetical protein GCM10027342_44480 [Photobacterium alginatilyticum]